MRKASLAAQHGMEGRCRGQVISDTPIGESGGCRFVVGGSSIAERGMEPDAVVEADDVVGDVSDCFGVIG